MFGRRHGPDDDEVWVGILSANTEAQDGRLNALLIGASVDGRGFDRESLEATYRRHQFDTLFGEFTTPDMRVENRSPSAFPDRSASELRASLEDLNASVARFSLPPQAPAPAVTPRLVASR